MAPVGPASPADRSISVLAASPTADSMSAKKPEGSPSPEWMIRQV
jgi:hypothetical protein